MLTKRFVEEGGETRGGSREERPERGGGRRGKSKILKIKGVK